MSKIRNLPGWVAITIWVTGFILVLIGELIAVGTKDDMDTISEWLWFILGVDQPITFPFFVARVLFAGLLGWLGWHVATKGRV